jgi:hypothetical protein
MVLVVGVADMSQALFVSAYVLLWIAAEMTEFEVIPGTVMFAVE